MRRIRTVLRVLRVLCLLLLCVCGRVQALDARDVVVVYNAASPLSCKAAQHYCRLRGVPPQQCFPLHDVKAGEISRGDFDIKIRMALLLMGRERKLCWPSGPANAAHTVRAMVLMPDLPLRIREETVAGAKHNSRLPGDAASVDSELMLLGADYPRDSFGRNEFFRADATLESAKPRVLAVCRIDAPTEAAVMRMMNDAVRVERTGLLGWVVVDKGGPYAEGDKWLAGVERLARQQAQPLFSDSSRSTLAESFPLMRDTAVYFGWYANPPNGPFREGAAGDFRFAPGALAFHLHSFSATSIKNAGSWVGALLQRGAAVTAGNVAEPMLGTCLQYDVFYERLLAGYTVAEAALMATPVVSWQGIILGDPLYRPFPNTRRVSRGNVFAEWRDLLRQAGDSDSHLRSLVESRIPTAQGALWAEMYAWHCAENKELERAADYFALAGRRYVSAADDIRTAILQATCLYAANRKTAAESLLRDSAAKYATSPHLPALRQSLNALFPPPKKSASPAQ